MPERKLPNVLAPIRDCSPRAAKEELCKLCGSPNPAVDLISPCGCNYRAHRDCIKKYIIQRRLTKCPYCTNDFLVSYTYGKRFACGQPQIVRQCLLSLSLVACSVLVLGLGIGILCGLVQSKNKHRWIAWEVVAIVLMALAEAVLVLYLGVVVYEYCVRKEIVDIAIYCSKTEIAKGMENPQKNLRRFFDWLLMGGYYDRLRKEKDFPELRLLLNPAKRRKHDCSSDSCGGACVDQERHHHAKKKKPSIIPEPQVLPPVRAPEAKEDSREHNGNNKHSEVTLSKVQIEVPEGFGGNAEDPNEAVIYSCSHDKESPSAARKSEEKDSSEALHPGAGPAEESKGVELAREAGASGRQEIVIDSARIERLPGGDMLSDVRDIASVRKLVDEVGGDRSKDQQQQQQTETIFSAVDEIKVGEVDVVNHVMSVKQAMGDHV